MTTNARSQCLATPDVQHELCQDLGAIREAACPTGGQQPIRRMIRRLCSDCGCRGQLITKAQVFIRILQRVHCRHPGTRRIGLLVARSRHSAMLPFGQLIGSKQTVPVGSRSVGRYAVPELNVELTCCLCACNGTRADLFVAARGGVQDKQERETKRTQGLVPINNLSNSNKVRLARKGHGVRQGHPMHKTERTRGSTQNQ